MQNLYYNTNPKPGIGSKTEQGDAWLHHSLASQALCPSLLHGHTQEEDGEGDEEAGEVARKRLEQAEEKERHKEIMRRMREGYDGRRGGIASGVGGARGMHRFDQLVAADNRDDAKRLGLLNDDELNSDDEEKGDREPVKKKDDEEDDEAALLGA